MNRRGGLALAGFLFALAWLSFASAARAASRAECNSVPSKILRRAVPYCVLLPPSYDADKARRYPVLYFLHGIGENEQALLNSGGWDLIQDLWDQKQMGEFVIAAPAGGRTFFINSRDGKVRYQDFLMREFLPYIESHYRIRAGRHSRGIAGISMGGYGALRLGLLFPQMFAAVSANSAALIAKLPHIEMATPGESNILARMLGSAFGSPFDRAFWDREQPVHDRAQRAAARRLENLLRLRDGGQFRLQRGGAGVSRTARFAAHPARIPPLSRRARLDLLRAAFSSVARISVGCFRRRRRRNRLHAAAHSGNAAGTEGICRARAWRVRLVFGDARTYQPICGDDRGPSVDPRRSRACGARIALRHDDCARISDAVADRPS